MVMNEIIGTSCEPIFNMIQYENNVFYFIFRTCIKKCENIKIPCVQKLVYITFSSNKNFLEVPGYLMDLEHGGEANNSKYFIESQPFGNVFAIKLQKSFNKVNFLIKTIFFFQKKSSVS